MKFITKIEDKYVEAEIKDSKVIISICSTLFLEDPEVVMILNERELKSLIQFLKGVYYIFKGTKS